MLAYTISCDLFWQGTDECASELDYLHAHVVGELLARAQRYTSQAFSDSSQILENLTELWADGSC